MKNLLLVIAMSFVLLGAASASAATFMVDATDDRLDENPADDACGAVGGGCTLRAAVQQANATPGPDAIVVPPGIYRLTIRGSDEDASVTGDLDIFDTVTITGAGVPSTMIDAAKAHDRVFDVFSNATISDLTIRRGRQYGELGGGGVRNFGTLHLKNALVTRCRSTDDAGGVEVRAGFARIEDVVVSMNRTGDDGGGVDVDGGTAELTRVLITHNRARDEGGGLENSGAVVTLTQCRITQNRARKEGGGLSNEEGGTLSIVGSLVAGNRAKIGGGISTRDTALGENTTMVRDTTIAKNRKRDCIGTLMSFGGNVDDDGSCGF